MSHPPYSHLVILLKNDLSSVISAVAKSNDFLQLSDMLIYTERGDEYDNNTLSLLDTNSDGNSDFVV